MSKSTLKIHILHPPKEDALAILQNKITTNIELTFGAKLPQPALYEILVAGRPNKTQLMASPHLKQVVIPFAGLPDVTRTLMLDFPHLDVHNLHHNAAITAETALALLLAAAKFVVPYHQDLQSHNWTRRYEPSPSVFLSGKTALILGYGHIGQLMGRYCLALGMRVLATRRQVASLEGEDLSKSNTVNNKVEIHPPQALPTLLPQANVLIITLPHTSATDNLIDAEALASLPAEAILVNVGRGPIVNEAALYHALKNGSLYAAALDVWYTYPADKDSRSNTPPSTYPFHTLSNVVMSPHRAGHSTKTEVVRMTHLAELLNMAAKGKKLPNKIDLKIGY